MSLKLKGKDVVVMFACACVTALGAVYILKGGDSVVIASVTGMVGTVIGYYFGVRGAEA